MSRAIRRALGALARGLAAPAALTAFAVLGALLFVPAPGPSGRAVAAELKIEAPRFTFDQNTHTYTYEDGRLTLGALSLFASHMELNTDTGQVLARGQVHIRNEDVSGIAESLEMDANTRVGTLHGAHLYVNRSGLYLSAEEVVVHPDGRLRVRRSTLTSCPPETPGAWSIAATSLELEPEGLGVAWNPRLFIGPVPLLWLPGIAWPTVDERSTGLLVPDISRETSSLKRFDLGWRVKQPVFVNLGYDHDLTATPEWIENRGWALGLEYNYAFWEHQRGRFTLWGLHERDPRVLADENDVLGGATAPTKPLSRYRADWDHNQALGSAGRLVLTYRDSSDGQVRREYDGVTEYRPYRTYQASYSAQWDWTQLALTFEQNANFLDESVYARDASFTDVSTRPQLLPRLTTNLGGRLFDGLPLTLELGLTATRFQAREDLSGDLFTADPTVSLPLSLGGAFELRPSVTRHLVRYTSLEDYNSGTPTQLPEFSFAQTEANLELRTALARIYTPAEGPFEAIKHRIVPRLIFTEVQDVPQAVPLAAAPAAYHDGVLRSRVAQRLATLRIDNTWLGRARSAPGDEPGAAFPAPDGPVSELLRVDLIQRYNLLLRDNAPAILGPTTALPGETHDPASSDPLSGEPLLPLRLELEAHSGRFAANALMNYHYQLHRSTESALSLSGSSAGGTSLGIAYASNEFSYSTPDNKTVAAGDYLSFGGVVRWTDAWSMGFSGRVNLTDNTPPLDRRVDHADAYVEYRPVCYAVRLSYMEAVASTVEGGTTNYYLDRHYAITFDLAGLVGGALRPAPRPAAVSSSLPGSDHGTPPAHCRS